MSMQPIVTSNNEYCLLDTIQNKVYRNSGLGAFTGGND